MSQSIKLEARMFVIVDDKTREAVKRDDGDTYFFNNGAIALTISKENQSVKEVVVSGSIDV